MLPARIAATNLFRHIGEYVVSADALRAHGMGAGRLKGGNRWFNVRARRAILMAGSRRGT
jgi:hypothetical protein